MRGAILKAGRNRIVLNRTCIPCVKKNPVCHFFPGVLAHALPLLRASPPFHTGANHGHELSPSPPDYRKLQLPQVGLRRILRNLHSRGRQSSLTAFSLSSRDIALSDRPLRISETTRVHERRQLSISDGFSASSTSTIFSPDTTNGSSAIPDIPCHHITRPIGGSHDKSNRVSAA